jgi:hypothetical protein
MRISPRRTSTIVPFAIGRALWIISPREETLRMQVSVHCAPDRTRALATTLLRSSRGRCLDIDADAAMPIA